MNLVYKAMILITFGAVFLRFSGRKSISQMTIVQTVIMISIGSLIVQPIAEKSIVRTIITAGVFTIFTMLAEYLQLKSNFIENLISGKAQIVIREGELVPENLKKLRMTVDQLEMRLRQQGISKISDVKTAAIEANGQLGYELMQYAKPVTIKDLEKILGDFMTNQNQESNSEANIFTEIEQNSLHTPHPKELK